MWEFYSTPLDILYLVLSVTIFFLVLFLVITLWHLIRILRNVNRITDRAKDTMDLVNHYLWQPIKILNQLIDKTKEKADEAVKKAAKKARKKST